MASEWALISCANDCGWARSDWPLIGSPLPWVSNARATPGAPTSAAAPHSAKTKPRFLMINPPGSPDQLNQVYKLGSSMPSREVASSTRRSPLVFRMRQTVFLTWRDTAIINTPQTMEEFDAIRRPFRRRGSFTPRLKRSPVADLARVAHGDVLGSAALVAAGVLLGRPLLVLPLAVLAASSAI